MQLERDGLKLSGTARTPQLILSITLHAARNGIVVENLLIHAIDRTIQSQGVIFKTGLRPSRNCDVPVETAEDRAITLRPTKFCANWLAN
jgi:hypothetical protein